MRTKYNSNKKNNQKGGNNFIDKDFIKCYDKNLQKVMGAINEYSGKHNINPERAREFIDNQTSPIRREAAKNLVENTIYITLEEVFNIVEKLIDNVYINYNFNNIESNIYIYSGKIEKSSYFLCVLALYHIRQKNYKEPIFLKTLTDECFDYIKLSPLIILDDVSYSGSQLSDQLKSIYSSRMYVKNAPNPPDIYILLISLNDISKKKLSLVPSGPKNKYGAYPSLKDSPFKLLYLPDRLYKPLISILGIEKYVYMKLLFSPWLLTDGSSDISIPHISLYLDSKIADPVSTFTTTLIYGQIPPSNIDFSYFIDSESTYGKITISNELEKDEIIRLTSELPEEFKKFKNRDILPADLVDKIITKFMNLDTQNTDKPSTEIIFKPFINTCYQDISINKIINDKNIANLDYLIFMIPEECFGIGNDECSFNNEVLLSYLENKNYIIQQDPAYYRKNGIRNTITEKGSAIFEMYDRITKVKCPVSWYKNGPFKMDCITTYGGKKNKTKKILKNRKTRRRYKNKK